MERVGGAALVAGCLALACLTRRQRVAARIPISFEVVRGRSEGFTYLVTGGSGMLGGRVLVELARMPDVRLLSLDLTLPPPARRVKGVTYVRCDLTDRAQVLAALREAGPDLGCVLHIAAAMPTVGATEQLLMRVNGAATEQLLELCQAHGVRSFVYCCSCSAVMDARRSTWDGCTAEELSYPPTEHFLNAYGRSKAAGERAVLERNTLGDAQGRPFCSCSLRVSCMVDARDQGYGSLLALGFPNFVYFGEGTQVVDMVWSLDVARALVQAACVSAKTPERVGGRAFHIGGLGRPLALKEWVTTWDAAANRYLWGGRLPPLWIPRWGIQMIAQVNFRTFQMLGVAPISPLIRPDTVGFTDGSLSYWFDLTPARDAFGYEPSPVRDVIEGIRDEVLGAPAKRL